MKIEEGYIPFAGYQTYYRVVGECEPGRLPLLVIHGGPGASHYYLRPLDIIAQKYGRAVVYYDQLSCGNSKTPPLPDKWGCSFFLEELSCVRSYLAEHYGWDRLHALGQSWGGMLAMMYAIGEPWHGFGHEGLASMTVSSSPADMDLWLSEAIRLRSYLPQQMREALEQADVDGDYERPEVKAAAAEYYRRHVSLNPSEALRPEDVTPPDPVGDQCYHFMQGMSEFVVTGALSHWSVVDQLGQIDVPTLVTSGAADECTPIIAKQIADGIPGARWELFKDGTHWVHGEQQEHFGAVVEGFLEQNE